MSFISYGKQFIDSNDLKSVNKSLKESDRKRNRGNKIYSPLIIMEGINFSFDISNDDNGPQKVV